MTDMTQEARYASRLAAFVLTATPLVYAIGFYAFTGDDGAAVRDILVLLGIGCAALGAGRLWQRMAGARLTTRRSLLGIAASQTVALAGFVALAFGAPRWAAFVAIAVAAVLLGATWTRPHARPPADTARGSVEGT